MSQGKQFSRKVAVLGGGTGQFNLLRGLVPLNSSRFITAIPGTWDNGGSSGRLRTERGILPPGDARQCLIALMGDPAQQDVALALFNDRSIDDHSLGNLIIAVLEHLYHGQYEGLKKARELFFIKSKIIPSSLTDLELMATTKKGIELKGEEAIDHNWQRADYSPEDRINSIFFATKPEPNPQTIEAIKNAELVVLSSGSLYGSILPHLLIDEVRQAIIDSKAKLVFVLNLMTERGQTEFYSAYDHLEALIKYLKDANRLDYMIVNTTKLDPEILATYRQESQEPVEIDEEKCLKLAPNMKIIKKPLASYLPTQHLLRHDPEKLAQTILELELDSYPNSFK
jgi:uncharacterized cofD-like protein